MSSVEERQNVKEKVKLFNRESDPPEKRKPQLKPKPSDETRSSPRRNQKQSLTLFEKPHQLIKTDTKANKLYYVKETLDLLQDVDRQVNVVAITGQHRTGKSYLLNRLAGSSTGFEVGDSTNACTKGIWLWCRDHPVQEGQVLLLLDVEGFGDVYKANEREDFLLFSLATLLCSTLIYNNKGAFQAEALMRLRFLEDIESNVCVIDQKNDIDLLDFYFPQFVLTLRDFDLDLKTKAGNSTTADGYFEDVLVQQRGSDQSIKKYNRTRLLIRNYFKERRCFAFKQPCLETNHMERAKDSDLAPAFVKSLQTFLDFVYKCKPMAMKSGRAINGRMFSTLAKTYVDQISAGKPPCIRDAFVAMTKAENESVIEQASIVYSDEMKRRLEVINPNDAALVNHHQQCMEMALKYFKSAVVFDEEEICHKQMQTRFKELFGKFKKVCDKNSEARCHDVLNRLNLKIVQKIKNNVYAKETGYDEYIDDVNTLVKRYDGTCGLGTQSRAVLQIFLDGKADEEEMIHRLVLKATGKESEGGRSDKLISSTIQRSPSYHVELTKSIRQLERQLSTEFEEKQDATYEDIKQKYIEKLTLQLKEIDRQIQEGAEEKENLKALESERSWLIQLIDASKQLEDLSGEVKEKLHAKPLDSNRYSIAVDETVRKVESPYDVPWDRLPRPCPLGMEYAGEMNEYAGPKVVHPKAPRKRKPFCFIQ